MTRIAILLFAIAVAPLAGCSHMNDLQARVTDQEREITRLRQENKEFQDAYYQIKSTMDNETGKAGIRVSQIERELEQARNLQTQKETELANQLRTRSLEVDALRSEMNDFKALTETRITQLAQQLQSTGAERDAALQRLSEREEALRGEQARAEDLTKQLAQVKVDLQAAQDNSANLQKELAAANQTLQARAEEVAAAQQSLEARAAELAEATQRGSEFEARVKELDAQVAEISKRAEGAEQAAAKNRELEQQLARAREDAKTAGSKAAAASSGSLAEDPELADAAAKFKQALSEQGGTTGSLPIDVRQDKSGLRVMISSDALFKKNAIVLADNAPSLLTPVIELIKSLPGREVSVGGHTDNQPVQDLPFADNWGLGFARADRVREYLMKEGGVPGGRLTALTRGAFEPLAENSGQGRVKNRRVEIVIGGKD